MRKPKIYRQGDILFVEVSDPAPDESQPVARESGRIIIARGESTGHAHAIVSQQAKLLSNPALNMRWIVADAPAEVVHEEHATITLPPGVWQVVQQREYTPQAVRTIAD